MPVVQGNYIICVQEEKENGRLREISYNRFCMGAAWRDLAGRKSNFNKILDHVKVIR